MTDTTSITVAGGMLAAKLPTWVWWLLVLPFIVGCYDVAYVVRESLRTLLVRLGVNV